MDILTPTSNEDSPSSAKSIVDDWNKWQGADSSERVHRPDDALQSTCRVVEELLPGIDNLDGVDHLRVETRRNLDSHACREEEEVKMPQVRFLVPWHQVVLDSVGENRIRRTSSIFGTSTDGHVEWILRNVKVKAGRRASGGLN